MVNLKSKAQDICKFQSDIARDASPAYANGSFKQKWTTLNPQKRREFVVEGLYQASCCCWLEERRGLCPEFTLTSLSGRGGGEYLRLLGIILQAAQASGSTTIKSPVLFPHPQVDYMWALPRAQSNIPGLQAWATDIILDRTLFGSAAIWYIFLAFVSTVYVNECAILIFTLAPPAWSERAARFTPSIKLQHRGSRTSPGMLPSNVPQTFAVS